MAPNYESDEVDEEEDDEEDEVEGNEEVAASPKKRSKKEWKDPNKPKRAMSAFFLYSQGNRARVKDESPTASFGEIARILARQFKELPEKEARKWAKKAEGDKIRYQDEMKDYIPAANPDGGGGKKSKKVKKDPNAPKRNMSAYFLYSIEARHTVKEESPEASFGDIARLISAKFKNLNDKERKVWDDKAIADKERYNAEMAEYNK